MSDIEGVPEEEPSHRRTDEDRLADDPARDARGTPAEGVVDPDLPDPVEPSEPG